MIEKKLKRYEPMTYAALRIVAGFMFLWHGSQKLLNFPASGQDMSPFIQYVGGGVELIGGILIMIGLFTSIAAFLASGTMAFAYWMAHGTNALLPIQNGGELAALYCFVFLMIAARGSGIWSVDAARGKNKKLNPLK